MAQQGSISIRLGRQPDPAQLALEVRVPVLLAQPEVKGLEYRRGGPERRFAVRPFACPPRLAERHSHLGADDAHVPLKVAQPNGAQRQSFTFKPPEMIDQQIRIRPLRARFALVAAKVAIGLVMDRALRPQDRPRSATAAEQNLLNSNLSHHAPAAQTVSHPHVPYVKIMEGYKPPEINSWALTGRHVHEEDGEKTRS
ncbi:hypothetical protein, partial [Actinoplanes sp. NPDC049316]|uniref:hypothetical protein n=1 Tax=Actinoplanes sp. NPDC049316 TaxID=3154727 RepID=UPI003446AEE3